MAVPQVEVAINRLAVFGDQKWLWYPVLALSFTLTFVLTYCIHRLILRELKKRAKAKARREMEEA